MTDLTTKREIAEQATRDVLSGSVIHPNTSLPEPESDKNGNFIYTFSGLNDKDLKLIIVGTLLIFGTGMIIGGVVNNYQKGIGALGLIYPAVGIGLLFLAFFIRLDRTNKLSGVVQKKDFHWKYSRSSAQRAILVYELKLTHSMRTFRVTQEMFHALEPNQSVEIEYDPFTKSVLTLKITTQEKIQPKTTAEKADIEAEFLRKNTWRIPGKYFVYFGLALIIFILFLFAR